MIFNFDDFTEEVYEKFKDSLSEDKVQELLKLDDEYNFDSQKVSAERLKLKDIQFVGEKSDSTQINFSNKMNSGINVWIADNLKGKSSLFKIIKFALTGNNSIKNDVNKWLKEILLNFAIDNDDYAVYINLKNPRMSAKVFECYIDSIEDVEKISTDPLFEASSKNGYQDEIQKFFFDKFSYYSMQWTQKSSQKNSDDLLESNASWSTYFKSIYLESKDSDKLMFGVQDKKLFQMLLGLELTYPINRLSIRKDMSENLGAKHKTASKLFDNSELKERENLEKELNDINSQLNKLDNQNSSLNGLNNLYEKLEQTQKKLNEEIDKAVLLGRSKHENKKNIDELEKLRDKNQNEFNKITRELNGIEKRILDYEEYVEIGSFFSNLDIKQCPSCNHTVSKSSVEAVKTEKECYLCHDSIDENKNQINKEIYLLKTEELKINSSRLLVRRREIEKELSDLQEKLERKFYERDELEKKFGKLQNTEILRQELLDFESKIKSKKEKVLPIDTQRENLLGKRGELNYRLKQFKPQDVEKKDLLSTEIELLDFAIERLSDYRYQSSKDILKRLSELMLSEIHEFGLHSITKIEITENFDVSYEQDGDFMGFSDIAEGEQLRAKIAFYLSLIQLEIDQNVGRHTRLLIIDSPAKEEGDSTYLEGLSDVLRNIEKRFGDKLQILIGTAERNLVGIAENEFIIPNGEYVF